MPDPAVSQRESDSLSRNLKSRHIQLIALGGTIGVGLFLGSAKAISKAGPGLLLSYAIGGLAIFFIMRALGELLTYRPVAGSFATYADEFCGPFAGFATGWSYWFTWIATAMAELTAIGVYVHYWFPNTPQWIPALIALGLLYGANLLAVKVFGELEFWFALVKVVTIVALILAGLAVIFFHVGTLGPTAGFSNIWSHGGFLPFGPVGMLLTLQIAMFAYTGVELIGVTAGEAENPAVVLPKATNGITFRILIFYIGALVIIMSLVPWNQLSPTTSPFVFLFEKLGVPGAASVINLVVITAASSSCNSGLFSTGRMLHSLATRRQAPKGLGRLNAHNVPATGIHVSAAVMLIAVGLNYGWPSDRVFSWVTSVATVGSIWTWGIILVAHRNYRVAVAQGRASVSSYRMPGAPYANWLALAFLLGVTATLWLDPDNRVALYVAPFWFLLLWVGYVLTRSRTVAAGSA
ncbi:MAG TPA: amino acid permease [Steroidobacteraceae bacterium]|jgi:AAT family amino acid transporter/D-serine/D-alanine/glycine transporter